MLSVDTHAHLDFADFDHDRESLIQDLAAQDIFVLNPASSLASNELVDGLTKKYRNIFGAVGLHPTEIGDDTLTKLPDWIEKWRKMIGENPRLVAIGEIGLDFHHKTVSAAKQQAVLRQFLTFAQEIDRPVIFHCRDAYGDLVTLLGDYPGLNGVIHCFSGNQGQAEAFLRLGLHLSFTANLTYPANEAIRQIAATVPLERIMLETDSPFLAPQSQRGKRNDPHSIIVLADQLALIKGVSKEKIIESTTRTAQQLFKLPEHLLS